ncbi:MAG: YncE family protein, partial [Phycisphaerales bacterium]
MKSTYASRRCLMTLALGCASFAQAQTARETIPLSVRQAAARQRLIETAPPLTTGAHPAFAQPLLAAPPADFGLPIGLEGSGQTPIPPLSPLSKGNYVNYDSPPVKSLALSSTGDRLFVADTPNNWLTILGAPTFANGGALGLIKHVPVGLEPVAVAVQPGLTDDLSNLFVWTANFMSDDLSVINTQTGQVEAVVPVGDEPVNIVFDVTGAFAFVITQGPSLAMLDGQGLDGRGALSVVDTAHRQVIFSTPIDANTPRAMVIDHERRRLIVAPVHSGNDTTVVGTPVVMTFTTGSALTVSTLHVAKTFSLTSNIFTGTGELTPWPDVSAVPGEPAPDVNRIIRSRGGPWQAIVNTLAPGGVLSPAAVS